MNESNSMNELRMMKHKHLYFVFILEKNLLLSYFQTQLNCGLFCNFTEACSGKDRRTLLHLHFRTANYVSGADELHSSQARINKIFTPALHHHHHHHHHHRHHHHHHHHQNSVNFIAADNLEWMGKIQTKQPLVSLKLYFTFNLTIFSFYEFSLSLEL